MKTRTKILTSIVAIILSSVLLFIAVTAINNNKTTPNWELGVRTVELSESALDAQSILNEFEDASLTREGNTTYFEGYKALDRKLFSEIDYINEEDFEFLEESKVKYNFSYNSETNIVTLQASMNNTLGEIDTDIISGEAFINENGEIDALMVVDGEIILLSEMRDAGLIENCGWFKKLIKSIVKVTVVTVVAVAVAAAVVGTAGTAAVAVVACAASTTQTVKANTNYSHNKKQSLHWDVTADGYIIKQSLYSDWNFGFSTLNEVGCEVIATYNVMKKIGKGKQLADVIYDFEMLNIDYDIGFGALGSNPRQIYRYLNKYNVKYTAYSSFDKLKGDADNKTNCVMIFTTKNYDSVMGIHSIHTFMIIKDASGEYTSFNGYIDGGTTNLRDAIKYQFDYAYIIG